MQKCKRPQFLTVITTPKLQLAFTEKAVCPDFNFRHAPTIWRDDYPLPQKQPLNATGLLREFSYCCAWNDRS